MKLLSLSAALLVSLAAWFGIIILACYGYAQVDKAFTLAALVFGLGTLGHWTLDVLRLAPGYPGDVE